MPVPMSQAPERRFDLRLHPTEAAHEAVSLLQPSSLRVYESSTPGLLTFVLYERGAMGNDIGAGTRLTRGQAIYLVNELADYLGVPSYQDGLQQGHVEGWEAAQDADLGSEAA